MSEGGASLISTADIARLAGQRRATVGNWKSRHADFPPERGRNPRGPLYDRAEVLEWLTNTNRLDEHSAEVAAIWELGSRFSGHLDQADLLALVLVVLAVRSKSSRVEWERLSRASPRDCEVMLRDLVESKFPFANDLISQSCIPAGAIETTLQTVRELDQHRVSRVVDAIFEEAARQLGHRSCDYLTPPAVRKLIVALAKPGGVVYNPGSRTGQLMLDAASAGSGRITKMFAQEKDSRIVAMAQLNLAIHDVEATIEPGDIFGDDAYPDLRADCVLSIPPWNATNPSLDAMADDPRWVWGEPGSKHVNSAWIQHCLYHVSDTGRVVIVVPERALVSGGRARRIRRRMIKAGLLQAVVALPAGLFSSTPMRFAVLVFAKTKAGAGDTLMIDLAASDPLRDRSAEALPAAVIDRTARTFHDWLNGRAPTVANASIATFDDIAANEFAVDPARYQSVAIEVSDPQQIARQAEGLRKRLDELVAGSRKADRHLLALLKDNR